LFGLLSSVHDLGAPLIAMEWIHLHQLILKPKEKNMYKKISKIALKGIALAMGVAVIVMSTLKTLDINAGVHMLGFGLAALALSNLQDNNA
jgi:hypothetical protein